MTDKVADDNYDDDYDDYKVIPWIASSKSSDQKPKLVGTYFNYLFLWLDQRSEYKMI